MQVITDAKELRKHTYKKVRNTNIFPKKDRLLADKMFDEAADLVADLMEANDHLLTDPEERELRFRAQRSALRNCRKLIDNIEFAHENLPGVTDDAFAFWSRLAAGVKNQTAAWYKKDRERAAKLVTETQQQPRGVCLVFSCRVGQQRPQRQERWHAEQQQRLQRQQRPAPRFDGSLDLLTGREAGEHNAPSSKEGISLPQPRPSDRPGQG